MRTVAATLLLSCLGHYVSAQPGDASSSDVASRERFKALMQAPEPFTEPAPWDSLDNAPRYIQRNRGSAVYLNNLLNSRSTDRQDRDRIAEHFAELLTNSNRLRETASRLDREDGAYYRESLHVDVLRLLVEVISEGRESFRFSASERYEFWFSMAEGRPARCHVVLPPDYSPDETYPLLVQVSGAASLLPSEQYRFIRVRPSNRGVWGFRSMSRYDVMQAIRFMKLAYPIDEDRVYMTGSSAGATGIMHTAALRQDVFAGLVPLVAFGNDLPLENFRNLPIRCEHGVHDWTSSIGNVRVQFQKLGSLGYDAVLNEHSDRGHNIGRPPPDTMEWLIHLKRDPRPNHIVHTCEHPRDGRAYWLRIETLSDPHQPARIEAVHDDDGLTISTMNIARFSLDRISAPFQDGESLTIDGDVIPYRSDHETDRLTLARDARWQVATRSNSTTNHRREYASGAAANLFQGEPLLVVFGTGADEAENQFLRQAANILARSAGPHFKPGSVRFRVVADSRVQDVPLDRYNLLLVGDVENNSYLRRIASRLPYSVEGAVLKAGDRSPLSLSGSVLSVHSFNPEYPDRLIYVVSPYLTATEQKQFLANPRYFLAGSDGFKMIDQPDLFVRGADLRIHREMQFDADWNFRHPSGEDDRIPAFFSDRSHLAVAHMKVMHQATDVDFALWWGPEDKGAFGGYDFNWLPTFAPESYTRADFAVRRRETETMTAHLSGEELIDIFDRWIATDEIITWPVTIRGDIKADDEYRIVIPMDLVQKLGTRRKVLSNVAPGPAIMPDHVANTMFRESPD